MLPVRFADDDTGVGHVTGGRFGTRSNIDRNGGYHGSGSGGSMVGVWFGLTIPGHSYWNSLM